MFNSQGYLINFWLSNNENKIIVFYNMLSSVNPVPYSSIPLQFLLQYPTPVSFSSIQPLLHYPTAPLVSNPTPVSKSYSSILLCFCIQPLLQYPTPVSFSSIQLLLQYPSLVCSPYFSIQPLLYYPNPTPVSHHYSGIQLLL